MTEDETWALVLASDLPPMRVHQPRGMSVNQFGWVDHGALGYAEPLELRVDGDHYDDIRAIVGAVRTIQHDGYEFAARCIEVSGDVLPFRPGVTVVLAPTGEIRKMAA